MPRNYYIPRWAAVIIAVILLLWLASVLTSCYTPSKAKAQFSRAAIAYPELPVGYCVDKYKGKTDTVIKGVTTTTFDTIYTGGETFFDTLIVKDTVRIIKTIQLPGTKVIERYVRVDTVEKESIGLLAKMDQCEIERRAAVLSQDREHKELLAWKKKAKQRFWIILGMGAAIAIGIVAMIRRKVVKKIPL